MLEQLDLADGRRRHGRDPPNSSSQKRLRWRLLSVKACL
jgi:hypothetical protein